MSVSLLAQAHESSSRAAPRAAREEEAKEVAPRAAAEEGAAAAAAEEDEDFEDVSDEAQKVRKIPTPILPRRRLRSTTC